MSVCNRLEYNQKCLKPVINLVAHKDHQGWSRGLIGVLLSLSLFCFLIPFTSLISELIILWWHRLNQNLSSSVNTASIYMECVDQALVLKVPPCPETPLFLRLRLIILSILPLVPWWYVLRIRPHDAECKWRDFVEDDQKIVIFCSYLSFQTYPEMTCSFFSFYFTM